MICFIKDISEFTPTKVQLGLNLYGIIMINTHCHIINLLTSSDSKCVNKQNNHVSLEAPFIITPFQEPLSDQSLAHKWSWYFWLARGCIKKYLILSFIIKLECLICYKNSRRVFISCFGCVCSEQDTDWSYRSTHPFRHLHKYLLWSLFLP